MANAYTMIFFLIALFLASVQAKACYETSCASAGGMYACIDFCKRRGCSEGGWCQSGVCKCFPWN
ncbi:hypothetical protein BY458DRAFT_512491 [Sporodiniella umbellata]|nr:hypothetical protein BY458DRAFT_512491 [Sporodiniella umbellata]